MPEIPHYFEQATRAAGIMQVMAARMSRVTAELEATGWTVQRFEGTVILKAPNPEHSELNRSPDIMSHLVIPVQDVTIVVMADKDATVARATLGDVTVTASAKRKPGDRPDAGIGADLALSRALGKLSRRLERRARGAMRNADCLQAARQERAAKRREQEEEEEAERAALLTILAGRRRWTRSFLRPDRNRRNDGPY